MPSETNLISFTTSCLIILSLAQCTKVPLEERVAGGAIINLQDEWIPNASQYKVFETDTVDITITRYCDNTVVIGPDNEILFKRIKLRIGKQIITTNESRGAESYAIFFTHHGCANDLFSETYYIDLSAAEDNWIDIKQINKKSIEVEFNLSFVIDENWNNPIHDFGDTLTFTNGFFTAELKD